MGFREKRVKGRAFLYFILHLNVCLKKDKQWGCTLFWLHFQLSVLFWNIYFYLIMLALHFPFLPTVPKIDLIVQCAHAHVHISVPTFTTHLPMTSNKRPWPTSKPKINIKRHTLHPLRSAGEKTPFVAPSLIFTQCKNFSRAVIIMSIISACATAIGQVV